MAASAAAGAGRGRGERWAGKARAGRVGIVVLVPGLRSGEGTGLERRSAAAHKGGGATKCRMCLGRS